MPENLDTSKRGTVQIGTFSDSRAAVCAKLRGNGFLNTDPQNWWYYNCILSTKNDDKCKIGIFLVNLLTFAVWMKKRRESI